jgi:hypothetical protein
MFLRDLLLPPSSSESHSRSHACCFLPVAYLAFFDPEEGGSMLLRNVGTPLPGDTASYLRQYFSPASFLNRAEILNPCLLNRICLVLSNARNLYSIYYGNAGASSRSDVD